jgi:peroxiredoxin
MQGALPARPARSIGSLRSWTPVAIAAIGVLIAAFLVLRPSNASSLVGRQAPDFTISGADGKPIRLADLRGHPVLLNFWGVNCIYCRTEMPLLQQAQDTYRGSGLIVLGIDVQGDDAGAIHTFVSERGITYRMALGGSYNWGSAYKVDPLPESVFVDRNGVVREDDPKPFLDSPALLQALKSIV